MSADEKRTNPEIQPGVEYHYMHKSGNGRSGYRSFIGMADGSVYDTNGGRVVPAETFADVTYTRWEDIDA